MVWSLLCLLAVVVVCEAMRHKRCQQLIVTGTKLVMKAYIPGVQLLTKPTQLGSKTTSMAKDKPSTKTSIDDSTQCLLCDVAPCISPSLASWALPAILLDDNDSNNNNNNYNSNNNHNNNNVTMVTAAASLALYWTIGRRCRHVKTMCCSAVCTVERESK